MISPALRAGKNLPVGPYPALDGASTRVTYAPAAQLRHRPVISRTGGCLDYAWNNVVLGLIPSGFGIVIRHARSGVDGDGNCTVAAD